MSKERLLRTNLIGKKVQVKHILGTIIDETKNMLIIQTQKEIKKMPKKNNTFDIEGHTLNGNSLIGRIEERSRK